MANLGLLAGVSMLLAFLAWRAREFLVALEPVNPSADCGGPGTLVSVIVPARNEAANIERCLRSVFAQDYAALEILAIDDNSVDATPEILAACAAGDSRLTVLQGAPLLPGWTGKNFALAQAAARARGEWLLFLDADTWLAAPAVRAALAYALDRRLGLLSLVTQQELGGFWERVLQPMVLLVIALALPLRGIGDPRRPQVAYANGQFLLVRRAAYEKVGGHEALREAVVEDSELARVMKQAGYAVQLADGRALVRIRMYRGLGDMWLGWSKNSFLSLGRRLRNVAALIIGVTVAAFVPPAILAVGLARLALHGTADPAVVITSLVAALQLAVLFYLAWRNEQEVGVPGIYALTMPLGAMLFNVLVCYSAYRVLSGRGVAWKGRVYPT
jgi:chlorobactene glucosyltransferase